MSDNPTHPLPSINYFRDPQAKVLIVAPDPTSAVAYIVKRAVVWSNVMLTDRQINGKGYVPHRVIFVSGWEKGLFAEQAKAALRGLGVNI